MVQTVSSKVQRHHIIDDTLAVMQVSAKENCRKGEKVNKVELEFWQAIKKGNGKAFLIMKNHPNINFDKYILNASKITYAYDQQVEEVRGRYLFQFIVNSKKRKNIEDRLLKRLYKYNKCDWTMYQLFNLAKIFGENGNQKAKEIMYLKLKKIVKKEKYWTMVDMFAGEIIEMDGKKGLIFIAKIYGRMVKLNNEFNVYDDFLEIEGLPNSKEILEKEELKNINIKYFMNSIRESDNRRQEYQESNETNFSTRLEKAIHNAETRGIFPFHSFNKPTQEEIELIAEKVVNEKNIRTKIAYLRFFSGVKFPLDINILFEMTDSDNEELKEKSISALQQFKSKAVRELYVKKIKEGKNNSELIKLLVNNYEEKDCEILEKIYKEEKNIDEKHGIGLSIFKIYESNNVIEGYKVLKDIYKTTNCSSCRRHAIEIIKKLNMLDEEIINEGMYDSNSDIKEILQEHYS